MTVQSPLDAIVMTLLHCMCIWGFGSDRQTDGLPRTRRSAGDVPPLELLVGQLQMRVGVFSSEAPGRRRVVLGRARKAGSARSDTARCRGRSGSSVNVLPLLGLGEQRRFGHDNEV